MNTEPELSRQAFTQKLGLDPSAAREEVEKVLAVDATSVDFGDPSVQFVAVPGTLESALVVRSDEGTTLLMNDVIFC